MTFKSPSLQKTVSMYTEPDFISLSACFVVDSS